MGICYQLELLCIYSLHSLLVLQCLYTVQNQNKFLNHHNNNLQYSNLDQQILMGICYQLELHCNNSVHFLLVLQCLNTVQNQNKFFDHHIDWNFSIQFLVFLDQKCTKDIGQKSFVIRLQLRQFQQQLILIRLTISSGYA